MATASIDGHSPWVCPSQRLPLPHCNSCVLHKGRVNICFVILSTPLVCTTLVRPQKHVTHVLYQLVLLGVICPEGYFCEDIVAFVKRGPLAYITWISRRKNPHIPHFTCMSHIACSNEVCKAWNECILCIFICPLSHIFLVCQKSHALYVITVKCKLFRYLGNY